MARHQRGRGGRHSQIRSTYHAPFRWSCWQGHLLCLGERQKQWLRCVCIGSNDGSMCFYLFVLVGTSPDQGKNIGIMFLVSNRLTRAVWKRLPSFRTKWRWARNIRSPPITLRSKRHRRISIRSLPEVKPNQVRSVLPRLFARVLNLLCSRSQRGYAFHDRRKTSDRTRWQTHSDHLHFIEFLSIRILGLSGESMSHSLLIEDAILEIRRPSNDSDYVHFKSYVFLNLCVCFNRFSFFAFSVSAQWLLCCFVIFFFCVLYLTINPYE